jgi:hypothetical protein
VEKVAVAMAVTEHFLEDREVAEATEPDPDLVINLQQVPLKVIMVVDLLIRLFIILLAEPEEEEKEERVRRLLLQVEGPVEMEDLQILQDLLLSMQQVVEALHKIVDLWLMVVDLTLLTLEQEEQIIQEEVEVWTDEDQAVAEKEIMLQVRKLEDLE